MSKIGFDYKGVRYTLEYTRDSATALQMAGFDDSKFGTQPLVQFPLLFKYSFMAHHERIKGEEIKDIYEHLINRQPLLEELYKMYLNTVETLTDEPEDDLGKVEWTVSG